MKELGIKVWEENDILFKPKMIMVPVLSCLYAFTMFKSNIFEILYLEKYVFYSIYVIYSKCKIAD